MGDFEEAYEPIGPADGPVSDAPEWRLYENMSKQMGSGSKTNQNCGLSLKMMKGIVTDKKEKRKTDKKNQFNGSISKRRESRISFKKSKPKKKKKARPRKNKERFIAILVVLMGVVIVNLGLLVICIEYTWTSIKLIIILL